jgi:hypothetical protein
MINYKNRYGDVFTFTKDENKDILWEGNFEYCRIGMPNDYTKAFKSYLEDREHLCEDDKLSFEEFKNKVHEYDNEKQKYVLDKYTSLVECLKDEIDMVDPSGGCYLSVGMSLDFLGFKDCVIEKFKIIPTGFKIITNEQ